MRGFRDVTTGAWLARTTSLTALEMSVVRDRVGIGVLGVEHSVQVQVGQLLSKADAVDCITRRAKAEQSCLVAFSKLLRRSWQ